MPLSRHSYRTCLLSLAVISGQLCEGGHHEGVELGSHVCGWLAGGSGGLAVSMWLRLPFNWLLLETLFFYLGNILLIFKERTEKSVRLNQAVSGVVQFFYEP